MDSVIGFIAESFVQSPCVEQGLIEFLFPDINHP